MRPHQSRKWTTKDGTKIHIRKMETVHIENCLKMLKRMHVAMACTENILQGDEAINCFEQGIDALIEGGVEEQFEDIWFDLEGELDYRKEIENVSK